MKKRYRLKSWITLYSQGYIKKGVDPIFSQYPCLQWLSDKGEVAKCEMLHDGDESYMKEFGQEIVVVKDTANPFSVSWARFWNPNKTIVSKWTFEHYPYWFEEIT